MLFRSLKSLTKFNRRLRSRDFPTEILWIIDINRMKDITNTDDWESKDKFRKFLVDGPEYNMLCICTCNRPRSGLNQILEQFLWVVDKTDRTTQLELNLPVRKDMLIEANQNFISIQNRNDKNKYVTVKKYFTS